MLYQQYIIKSTQIIQNIYEFLYHFSSSHNVKEITESEKNILVLVDSFHKLRDEYIDITQESVIYKYVFSSNWEQHIQLICSDEYEDIRIDIEFFIDHPKLNMYGIIITESGIEKHFTFESDEDRNIDVVITLSNNIKLVFNDNIINLMRKNETKKKGKILRILKNDKIVRLSINSKLKLDNHNWINATLNSLENEIYRITDLMNQSNNSTENIQTTKLANTTGSFLLYN